MTAEDADVHYMKRALAWAQRGLYTTAPNPHVGALIVKNGQIVGEGFHAKAGLPHAEIMALKMAGEDARGATCYVNLEPCSHHGRTGPCVKALIEAGISRVVFGMPDPNPAVQKAHGLHALEAAGIEVVSGVLETEAQWLNRSFTKRITGHRPFVHAKWAMSLDGKIALSSGQSYWITGSEARAHVQMIRASSDAIITGVQTVIQDNPLFTVRPEQFPDFAQSDPEHPLHVWRQIGTQPLLVVIDGALRIPLTAKLLQDPTRIVWIVTTAQAVDQQPEKYIALQQQKHLTIRIHGQERPVDLNALLQDLHAHQYGNLLVESGPALSSAFLHADLIDEIDLFVAPKLLGAPAKGVLALPEMPHALEKHPDWRYGTIEHMGSDIHLHLIRSNQT